MGSILLFDIVPVPFPFPVCCCCFFCNPSQLLEAHVRVYAIRHVTAPVSDSPGADSRRPISFQTASMRLTYPDDELGAMLFLHLPQMVIHQVLYL